MDNPRITQEEVGMIKKAQEGDKRAFDRIFNKYLPFVEKILFSYLNDMDEARDLANVVFMKVYDKLSTFTAYDSFGGWLRIISNRTAIDYLRENKNLSIPVGALEDTISPEVEDDCNIEEEVVNRLIYEQIIAEFDKFPDKTRQICKLFYVDQLTVEQISNVLSIPTGTIKSMLSRTRSKIKKTFKL